MNKLIRNSKICVDCGHCESVCPSYIKTMNGVIFISDERLKEEEVSQAVDLLVQGCPAEAITLEQA